MRPLERSNQDSRDRSSREGYASIPFPEVVSNHRIICIAYPSHAMTLTEQETITQLIGNYRIEALIGSGGMGQVFRARHIEHHEQVAAVKVLHTSFASDLTFQARFQQEASANASLSHPHIVKVFETGSQNGRCYLAMELLLDGSLHTLLQHRSEQPWPLILGLDLIRQAA